MYTHEKVSVFLKPVTFCVLLLLGAAPTATLVCHWVCDPRTDQTHRHASHHEHSGTAVQGTHVTIDTAAVRSSESVCDHRAALAPALTSAIIKVFALATMPAAVLHFSDSDHADVFSASYMTASPPGARSRPLSLRI